MIQQQINLFQYLPKKAKFLLDIKKLSVLYLAFFSFLMLMYFSDIHKKNKTTVKLNDLIVKMNQEDARFKKISAQYAWINPKDLETSMNKLKQDLEFNENQLQELFNQKKFSDYMMGLSQATIAGAWLTSFNIMKQGADIELKGRSLNAELANRFLIQLQSKSAFANANLTLEELSKAEAAESKQTYLNFNISTQVSKIP